MRIPTAIRERVNREFEAFVADRIQLRRSFAVETTLRSGITFEQARQARAAGFTVEMIYVALGDFSENFKRVRVRAFKGGHSGPESVLRSIHAASLSNLPRAIREMDLLHVYDNSEWGAPPTLLLRAESGAIVYRRPELPEWLLTALAQL